VVEVTDSGGNIVATMTMTPPRAEFTTTVQDTDADGNPDAQTYNLRVTWMTGPTEVTNVDLKFSAQIAAIIA